MTDSLGSTKLFATLFLLWILLNGTLALGTLEPGKDADFVILSGDPFSVYTRVLETWVEGNRRFDLDDPEDRAIADGGYGVLHPSTVHAFHGYEEGH